MTIFTGGAYQRPIQFLEDFTPPTGEVLGAFADTAITYSPLSSLRRMKELTTAEEGMPSTEAPPIRPTGRLPRGEDLDESGDMARILPKTRVLTTDEQSEIIEQSGMPIKPQPGMTEESLNIRIARKHEELIRTNVISRATTTQLVEGFAVGLVASMMDPINIASAFIPVVAPSRYALQIARAGSSLGRTLVRTRVGALEGAVGAAVVEPVVFAAAHQEQADYDAVDSLLNIAFGAGIGAGLHAGVGAFSDAVARRRGVEVTGETAHFVQETLTPEMQKSVMRASIAKMVSDEFIDLPLRARFEGSTAVGRILDLESPEFRATRRSETRGEPVDARFQRLNEFARARDPELFAQIEQTEARLNTLIEETSQIQARASAFSSAEIKAASRVEEINNELKNIPPGTDRRKVKRIERKLREERDKILSQFDEKKIKARLKKLRSIDPVDRARLEKVAPEISALRKTQSALEKERDRMVGVAAKEHPVIAREEDIFDIEAIAKQESQLDRTPYLRLADQDRVVEVQTLAAERPLDEAMANEQLAEESANLDEVAQRLGVEPKDAEIQAIADEAKLMEDHRKGLRALALCQFGKA